MAASAEASPAIRGLHLDPARRQLTPDTVIEIVEMMAGSGLNTLHLHLSDDQGVGAVLHEEFPDLAEVTAGRPPWSFEDQRRIGAACRRHGIRVVPEIDIPGHSVALRELIRLREEGAESAAYSPATQYGVVTPGLVRHRDMPIVLEIFEGLAERFGLGPGDSVHMGGDEWGGLRTALQQPEDTVENPTEGSWNYARAITAAVCEWAAGRELTVIAWEEHFKRLLGYQEMTIGERSAPRVDLDIQIAKNIVRGEDGKAEIRPAGDGPKVWLPSWTFEELSDHVYRIPDNLLMQTWINNPTREWQRAVFPASRQVKSNGYYLDAMWKAPLEMVRETDPLGLRGTIACVWGEWIGEENIRATLRPMVRLLGEKFVGGPGALDQARVVDILRDYAGSEPEREGPEPWMAREWVGFGSAWARHPMTTCAAPPRATPMTEARHSAPVFPPLMAQYVVAVHDYVADGTRCPEELAEHLATQAGQAALSGDPEARGRGAGGPEVPTDNPPPVALAGAIKTEFGGAGPVEPAELAEWLVRRLLTTGPAPGTPKARRAHVRKYLTALNRKTVLLPESSSATRAGDSCAGTAKIAAFPNDPGPRTLTYRNSFWMANRYLKIVAAEPKPVG